MAFEPAPLAAGLAAFLPGLTALLVLYSPFDGYFRDNIIFLWFVGGLLIGTFAALLDAWVLALAAPLAYILGAPLVEQGAKLVFLNRRKWHGDRQAVWNGGAMGAGLGTMVALLLGLQTYDGVFTWEATVPVMAMATGVSLLHVATGLFLGAGVVRREPFRTYGLAALATVPLAFLVAASTRALGLPFLTGFPTVLSFLALAYGLAALLFARQAWLPEGVGADELRRIRRADRAARRG